MKLLRWLGIIVAVLVVLLVAVGVAARFSDGPLGIVPSGPLEAGELVTARDVDFSFVDPISTIELQLVDPPRSRTVWVVQIDGVPYVPCGFLNVPLWKQWPHQAMVDGRAILRIDGKLYERQAVRVIDLETFGRVLDLVSEKYELGRSGEPDPNAVWIFRMDPRPAS